uniref:Uncharacterized protein n=1 Tax=Candidatus Kentrum sp. TUN TaxID=2126343 RepID=A0A450ZY85_9GAMM|nr:MAG: hypothetical protein BECKTUN1418F_GA0071002_10869 [Candidatus Kentron sp. TUN]VFK58733.1 MAG: hypothetical protein BECKTUN1418D_GA0071000_10888 [Candidatus Kentron sp. TUN]VFK62649.1 MAG: hypothetical protein BECKTUN1418E_GA0071001_10849 [Candidatus Kentron sp. TUN]
MDDLSRLLNAKESPTQSQELWMESLVPSGLVRAVGGKTLGNLGEFFYEVTPIGNKLRNAHFQAGEK